MNKLLIFLTLSLAASNASAEPLFLICEVEGKGYGWGPSYNTKSGVSEGLSNSTQHLKMKVLATIYRDTGQPVGISVEPQCKADERLLFSCNSITSEGSEFQVFNGSVFLEKTFDRDISIWRQSASLNRVTRLLRVRTERRYKNPPDEGWSISYEGFCRVEQRTF